MSSEPTKLTNQTAVAAVLSAAIGIFGGATTASDAIAANSEQAASKATASAANAPTNGPALPADLVANLLAEMGLTSTGELATERTVSALDAILDLDTIAKESAGHYYEQLDDGYVAKLRASVAAQIAQRINNSLAVGQAGSIRVLPAGGGSSPDSALVPIVVEGNSGVMVLRFHFAWMGEQNGWQATDIDANGASLRAFLKEHYTALIRRFGIAVALR